MFSSEERQRKGYGAYILESDGNQWAIEFELSSQEKKWEHEEQKKNSENLIMPMNEAIWRDFFGMKKVKEGSWKKRK